MKFNDKAISLTQIMSFKWFVHDQLSTSLSVTFTMCSLAFTFIRKMLILKLALTYTL